MKIYTLALLVLSLAASCKQNKEKDTGRAAAGQQPAGQEDNGYVFNKDRPYPYEKGIIEYKYTGDFTGTQRIYFKDYGRTLTVEEDYMNETGPVPVQVQQMFIHTPDKYYYIDLGAQVGYVAPRSDSSISGQVNLLSDITTMGIDSTMKKNGYRPSGTTEISGKRCVVYRSAGGESEFCFWEGMNIKTEMTLGPNVSYRLEAVSIKENADVPEDKFTPPPGVQVLEYEKYLKKQTKDKL